MKKVLAISLLAVCALGCDVSGGFEKTSDYAERGAGYARVVGKLPVAQPYASATEAILGGIAVLTGAAAVYFRKKQKEAEI